MGARIVAFSIALVFLVAVAAAAKPGAANGGFAVVELFTSEGCSSCPPADEALALLSTQSAQDQLPVYTLEWHVDYWDSLGWKDPFASHLATERQYAYAAALHSSVYTPEAVVNGHYIASWAGDLHELERSARALVGSTATAVVKLEVLPPSTPSALELRVQAAGGGPGSRVLVALVEDGLSARPAAGENAGRELRHSSVVRAVVALPSQGGIARLAIPYGLVRAHASFIAFVQEESMRIVAADRVGLSPRPGATLSGRLVDPTGRPVAGRIVQACSGSLCVPAVTDATGAFAVSELGPGVWSLVAGPRTKPTKVVITESSRTVALQEPLVTVAR